MTMKLSEFTKEIIIILVCIGIVATCCYIAYVPTDCIIGIVLCMFAFEALLLWIERDCLLGRADQAAVSKTAQAGFNSRRRRMNKIYWYYQDYYECPVCGRGGCNRERRYTEKPSDASERYTFRELYDYCLEIQACRE